VSLGGAVGSLQVRDTSETRSEPVPPRPFDVLEVDGVAIPAREPVSAPGCPIPPSRSHADSPGTFAPAKTASKGTVVSRDRTA
jgi:hypothetical protein